MRKPSVARMRVVLACICVEFLRAAAMEQHFIDSLRMKLLKYNVDYTSDEAAPERLNPSSPDRPPGELRRRYRDSVYSPHLQQIIVDNFYPMADRSKSLPLRLKVRPSSKPLGVKAPGSTLSTKADGLTVHTHTKPSTASTRTAQNSSLIRRFIVVHRTPSSSKPRAYNPSDEPNAGRRHLEPDIDNIETDDNTTATTISSAASSSASRDDTTDPAHTTYKMFDFSANSEKETTRASAPVEESKKSKEAHPSETRTAETGENKNGGHVNRTMYLDYVRV